MPKSLHALAVLGTRPEAIKLAPLIHALRDHPKCRVTVVSTGQHREMLRPMLELFGIDVAADLDLQRPDQTLDHIVASVLTGLPPLLAQHAPDTLVVQGDTTTSFAAALCAFHHNVPVTHLEAGLRTENPRIPFPEEMNRRLTSRVAALHLAPTRRAAETLLREGVPPQSVTLTGNTVVDALEWLRHRPQLLHPPAELEPELLEGRRLLLVTGHRRESFGEPFRALCRGLRRIADEHPDTVIVYPVHLNPRVQAPVREILGTHDRIRLLAPVPYPEMIWLLERAALVLTDSGGIQEEAPSFRVPVLVMREVTERMEAVEAGVALLVGTDEARIVDEARLALRRGRLGAAINPFGDGHAAERSVAAMLALFGRS